jgi:DNA-binding GntR family transcriptional regulator
MPSSGAQQEEASDRLPAIRRVTTAGAIFDRLYADILSLRLPPGTALQEKKIAEEFRVSRTPVREALLRLS